MEGGEQAAIRLVLASRRHPPQQPPPLMQSAPSERSLRLPLIPRTREDAAGIRGCVPRCPHIPKKCLHRRARDRSSGHTGPDPIRPASKRRRRAKTGRPLTYFSALSRPHRTPTVANVASACCSLETRALTERNLGPDVTAAHNSRPTHQNLGIVAAVSPLAVSDFQASRQTDVGRVSCGPDCDPGPDLSRGVVSPSCCHPLSAPQPVRASLLRTSAALPRSCRGPRALCLVLRILQATSDPVVQQPRGGRKPGLRLTHGGQAVRASARG